MELFLEVLLISAGVIAGIALSPLVFIGIGLVAMLAGGLFILLVIALLDIVDGGKITLINSFKRLKRSLGGRK